MDTESTRKHFSAKVSANIHTALCRDCGCEFTCDCVNGEDCPWSCCNESEPVGLIVVEPDAVTL